MSHLEKVYEIKNGTGHENISIEAKCFINIDINLILQYDTCQLHMQNYD